MRPHPSLSPYLVRGPGLVELVVPLLGREGAEVIRIPLSERGGRNLMRELAGALCDQWAAAIVRQTDDTETLSHEGFLQTIDG